MVNKVYVGDVGTAIVVDAGENLDTSTTHNILVEKPDGTETTWTGAVYQTTKIRYLTQTNDLNMTGRWRFMPDVAVGGWDGSGDTVTLTVYSKFH